MNGGNGMKKYIFTKNTQKTSSVCKMPFAGF